MSQIMHAVSLIKVSETVAELHWSSNTSNDMIADSALALLLGIDTSPATVKRQCDFSFGSAIDISQ